jgi:hypothetical protein
MKKKKLQPNDSLVQELNLQLQTLALPIPGNSNTSDMIADIEGKNFSIQANDKHIQHVSFHFDNELCTLNIKSDTESYDITFAPRKWHEGVTTKKDPIW